VQLAHGADPTLKNQEGQTPLDLTVVSSMQFLTVLAYRLDSSPLLLICIKLLKRAGAGTGDLLGFYNAIIRPVLEYASPVWH